MVGSVEASGADGGQLQVVVFSIGDRVLGVEILKVQEILRMARFTPFPNMPAFALGAINVRGRIAPLINLRLKLGLPDRAPEAKTCIMLVRTGGQLVGFLVDEVSEVIDLPSESLENTKNGPEWMRSDLFSGVGKLPDKLLVIINPERLLSAQEERLLQGAGVPEVPE